MSYTEIINHIENQEDQDILWTLKPIIEHEGPRIASPDKYKGSCYNVIVQWETG